MSDKVAIPEEVSGDEPLVLKFGGGLVEQLGAQMYPSATATVAELISNSWDADARNVWVEMPFGDWADGEITVVDDGLGMTRSEAQHSYLVVGRNRREFGGQRTARKRLVHGRKGIGKLAAFGTASILEVKTKREDSPETAFRLDYNKLKRSKPTAPYEVEPSADDVALANPLTGKPLKSGTRIRLSGLRLKRRLDPGSFTKSMARRFALNEREMTVYINGQKLTRFEIDLEYRFPPRALPPEARVDGDWAVETLASGRTVRWWIGFTEKPIKDDTQQGISVIVRGRQAQRPFKFEAGGGTSDQLGQEYLVGEVEADWIDDEAAPWDSDDDYIQSNRDQLQLEDEDLAEFLEWGRRRMKWALIARGDLRREQADNKLDQNKALVALLNSRPARERVALKRVASAVARLPEAGDGEVVKVMEAVIGARESETTQELAHELALAPGGLDDIWPLLLEMSELDHGRSTSTIDARLEALSRLGELDSAEAVQAGIQLLRFDPGILDPRWEQLEVREGVPAAGGLRSFTLADADAAIVVVVLAAEAGLDTDQAIEATAAEADARGVENVLLLNAQDAADSDGWARLIKRSTDLHQRWRSLLESRDSLR